MSDMAYNNIVISEGLRRMWDGIRRNRLFETLPGEIWYPVKDYEVLYSISTLMRVRDNKRMKISNQRLNGDGYWQVSLRRNGIRQNKRVHRLFAEAIIPNPFHKTVINHKNLIKSDNIPCNIEWNTIRENNLHARHFGALPAGEFVKHSKLTALEVIEIYRSDESARKLAIRFKVTERAIVKIKKGISWISITKSL